MVEPFGPVVGQDSWELVRAVQGGDRAAFGRLYARFRPAVYGFLRGKVGDHTLAEDLTSETFVRALRGIGSVTEQRADPGAWLFRIARNLVLDHARSARSRLEHSAGEVPEPRRADQAGSGVVDEVAARAVRYAAAVTVARVLAGLPSEQRRAVALYELSALRSVADTAAAMGRSPVSVKGLRWRAMVAMREQLAAEGLTSTADCADALARADAAARRARPARISAQRPDAGRLGAGMRGAA
jgi:RNA polymerase sigma-70 factor (ECF subfamily)